MNEEIIGYEVWDFRSGNMVMYGNQYAAATFVIDEANVCGEDWVEDFGVLGYVSSDYDTGWLTKRDVLKWARETVKYGIGEIVYN